VTRLALAVAAVALAARLAVFAMLLPAPAKFYVPDSAGYHVRAVNLLEHGMLTGAEAPPFEPDVVRTPGYPVFVAGIYALAGAAPAAVVLAHAVLGALTAALTCALAAGLGLPPAAAGLAGLVVALDPVSVLTANLILTETFYTTLLVAAVASLVRHRRTARGRWLVLAAVCLGAATLTRPATLFLPWALAPLAGLADAGASWSWRRAARVGLPLALGATLVVAPWVYRNHRLTGRVVLTTIDASVLHYYWAPAVRARTGGPAARPQPPPENESAPTKAERAARWRGDALAVLMAHPGAVALVAVEGLGRLALDPGYTLVCTLLDPTSQATECFPGRSTMTEPGVLARAWGRFLEMRPLQQGTLLWSGFLLAVTYAGALVGLGRLVRARRWLATGLLGVVIAISTALSAGPQANSRFRIPIWPFLAVAAAAALGAPQRPAVPPESKPFAGVSKVGRWRGRRARPRP
jgi:4-amino-4-deoxy-L-arabinose transferase-like glycosyltransferase